ncbi:hypothetical protein B566_EDAN001901 [Ephemera danica]|nr:hypothetical protein B566_EDAN001901 [Ephemera danica]
MSLLTGARTYILYDFVIMHVLTPEMENFLTLHKYQLESSSIPKIFWEPLERKLRLQEFDAGDAFTLLKVDYEERVREPREPAWTVMVTPEEGISESDPNSIYLVDHAWTFRVSSALDQLRSNPELVTRLANMMDVNVEAEDDMTDKVYEEMWRYSQSYSLNAESAEDSVPIWYIMDEFGSGIQHCDEPNCRVVPFVHLPSQITYSLLFPLEDLECGEVVTRDYIEGPEQDPETRRALLLPWTPRVSFIDVPFTQVEPEEEFFSGGRIAENLPSDLSSCPTTNSPLKVYSEYSQVSEHLTHPSFVLTDDEDSADILWYTNHFKDYASLTPNKRVNQFPYESVLTVKDLLCVVCRRKAPDVKFDPETLETYPLWLPTTFNMKTELPQFVSYYERREAHGNDNIWICKPWNLARGLDTHISRNLNFMLRLPFSGPKIAQKYAENPVLFHRPGIGHVKFDVRYVIILKSVQPLTAFVYRQFFVRFANLPFQLSGLHEYERHFTVMNYENPSQLCHMKCADFVPEFESQHQEHKWDDVEASILVALRGALEGSASQPPPRGIPHSPQSRAVYAADLILTWRGDGEIQPKLLEINWMPDCQRACQYYPDFFNDIFCVLFLDQTQGKNVIPI